LTPPHPRTCSAVVAGLPPSAVTGHGSTGNRPGHCRRAVAAHRKPREIGADPRSRIGPSPRETPMATDRGPRAKSPSPQPSPSAASSATDEIGAEHRSRPAPERAENRSKTAPATLSREASFTSLRARAKKGAGKLAGSLAHNAARAAPPNLAPPLETPPKKGGGN